MKLLRRGYGESDVRKILGENFMRGHGRGANRLGRGPTEPQRAPSPSELHLESAAHCNDFRSGGVLRPYPTVACGFAFGKLFDDGVLVGRAAPG